MTDDCPSCSTVGETMKEDKSAKDYRLSHWPIQIKLMGTTIPFLNDADLMVAADCTAFAVHDFHNSFLKDKKLLIGCPKLDDAQFYVEKFTEIFSNISIKTLTCLIMQVPCCGGMIFILKEALKRSGKNVPLKEIILGVKGELLSEREISLESEEE
jgi:hypothetical protein